MEELKAFLKALKTDPQAKELINEATPETNEEALQLYAKAAGILGFSLSAEQIKEGIEKLAAEVKAKTASAEDSSKELDLDTLAEVAGGGPGDCVFTYNPNENCDFEDRCSNIFRAYTNEKNCDVTWNCTFAML